MVDPDADTTEIVIAYRDGRAFHLDVRDVECGHKLAAELVDQVREAIRAGREDGMRISIQSAFRTNEEQTRLHDGWTKRLPGYHPADPPGYSKHQDGTAIDLAFGSAIEREEFAAIAVAHGFTRPTPEPWHFVVSDSPLSPKPIPKEQS